MGARALSGAQGSASGYGTPSLARISFSTLTLVSAVTTGVLVIARLERKVSAGIQQRIGPEHAGPPGIIQALADGAKPLLKEDLIPSKGDSFLFSVGPTMVITPALVGFPVIPFGHSLVLVDLGVGVLFWIAVSSIAPPGPPMTGYGSNNKYSPPGGLRAAAQAIGYEIPLALRASSISLRAARWDTGAPPGGVHE